MRCVKASRVSVLKVSRVCRPRSASDNDVAGARVPLKFAEEDKDFCEALVPGAGERGEGTWSSWKDCKEEPRREYNRYQSTAHASPRSLEPQALLVSLSSFSLPELGSFQ